MSEPDPADAETALIKRAIDADTHTAVTVAESVAEAGNVPIGELPAIQSVVDTDALDAVFDGCDGEGTFTFHYAEHVVHVHADGWITVHEENRLAI